MTTIIKTVLKTGAQIREEAELAERLAREEELNARRVAGIVGFHRFTKAVVALGFDPSQAGYVSGVIDGHTRDQAAAMLKLSKSAVRNLASIMKDWFASSEQSAAA